MIFYVISGTILQFIFSKICEIIRYNPCAILYVDVIKMCVELNLS